MRKIFSVKSLLLFMGVVLLLLFSEAAVTYADTGKDYVVDDADILTANEEKKLEEKLKELSERLEFDIVVVTTGSLGGKSIRDFADDFYDYNDYGQRDDGSGCVFVRYINEYDYDVWISTKGFGIKCLSESDIQSIFDAISPEFSSRDYYAAFVKYADMVETEVENYKEPPLISFVGVVIALIIGLIVAAIYTSRLKAQLKSVNTAAEAKSYETSFELTSEKDRFIRSAVTKTVRESSSSSGGSGTHTSSSGSTHGGGGRHM